MSFLYSESKLSKAVGLARNALRDVRQKSLVEKEDWAILGNEVRLNEHGLKRLLVALNVLPKNSAPDVESQLLAELREKTGAATPTGAEPTEIHRLAYDSRACKTWRNPHVVAARLEGKLVRVKVKDKAKLWDGCQMPCRHLAGDLWELARPLPRFKGAW